MKFNSEMIWGDGSRSICFKNGSKDYAVKVNPNGSVSYKVGFDRVTNNVFGNGSKNVLQAGYRTLPEGPAMWRLKAAYERLLSDQSKSI